MNTGIPLSAAAVAIALICGATACTIQSDLSQKRIEEVRYEAINRVCSGDMDPARAVACADLVRSRRRP